MKVLLLLNQFLAPKYAMNLLFLKQIWGFTLHFAPFIFCDHDIEDQKVADETSCNPF